MALDKLFYVNTGKDGRLGDTGEEDVKKLVVAAAESDKTVLHFHGGMVSKSKGLETAERLTPVYQQAGAHPAFFVWESGLLETVRHNLHEIGKEKIFKLLLKRVLKHAVGKLTADAGMKAAGQLPYPTDIELAVELKKAEQNAEPYADLQPQPDVDELSDLEREAFEKDLEQDTDFQQEARDIAATALPDATVQEDGSKGVVAVSKKSTKTLMSPGVIGELEDDTDKGQKGLISTTKLIWHASKVLARVIRRFVKGRHHGVYVTTVEEILRELYVANIGGEIWYMMKKETADTFADGGIEPRRGGRLFIDELGARLAEGARPKITLVGHSTGAVFILNMLADVERCRNDPDHPWPGDVAFENVLFLAPACDFVTFGQALDKHRHLFRHFRMFAMDDRREQDDTLVPVIYPRSLLYFVSGVVERREGGKSAFDRPIVGMERYYTNTGVYDQPEIVACRQFLAEDPGRAVWSVVAGDPGLSSNSVSHGGFDDTDPNDPLKHTTMRSVQQIIREGILP